jgi:hypothetical protein
VGLLQTIEGSAFCTWVREDSSLWAYPGILFMHVAGTATLVGISVMVALRLVGFAPKLPVPPFERFFPIIWGAFWINAASGTVLLAIDATAKLASPLFGAKMLLIALGTVDMVLIRRVVFRGRTGGRTYRRLEDSGRRLADPLVRGNDGGPADGIAGRVARPAGDNQDRVNRAARTLENQKRDSAGQVSGLASEL